LNSIDDKCKQDGIDDTCKGGIVDHISETQFVRVDKCLVYPILHMHLTLIMYEFDIILGKIGPLTLNYIMRSREVSKKGNLFVCDIFVDIFKEFRNMVLSPKAEAKHQKMVH